MNQKIVCQRGRCIEDEFTETEFDYIFEPKNIVDQIQKDLLKNMMN
jgi:hypothetical protein